MLSIKSSEVGFKNSHSHHSHHTHNENIKSPLNAPNRRVSKFNVGTGVASGEATANSTNNSRQIQKKTFVAFVMISEAYMIDPRYHTSSLSFRLCIGPNGYDVRSAAIINLTKSQTPIRLGPKMPCYLSIDKSKPCLTLQFEIEDLRYFMYCKNFLRNSVKELVNHNKKNSLENEKNIFSYGENIYYTYLKYFIIIIIY